MWLFFKLVWNNCILGMAAWPRLKWPRWPGGAIFAIVSSAQIVINCHLHNKKQSMKAQQNKKPPYFQAASLLPGPPALPGNHSQVRIEPKRPHILIIDQWSVINDQPMTESPAGTSSLKMSCSGEPLLTSLIFVILYTQEQFEVWCSSGRKRWSLQTLTWLVKVSPAIPSTISFIID